MKDEAIEEIKGHRVILAARSPVFEAMFYRQMESNKVVIEDASPESFKLFLSLSHNSTNHGSSRGHYEMR
ncbi:hypothetical protein CHS0354_015702 [Potamilus streckersoni]|uniref:BTB domain-containing protein n=1 Tax=Potamilus streckersoni TaxID=2493646 RepID=A0AAE0WB04_9BIVA|nr:hypothetical protein CHS0354_015702 [Potamilus streckersoni]